jgi:hypothetical protein
MSAPPPSRDQVPRHAVVAVPPAGVDVGRAVVGAGHTVAVGIEEAGVPGGSSLATDLV